MTYTQEEINLIVLSDIAELTYKARRALLSDLSSASPDFEKCKNFLIKTLSDGVYNKVKASFYDAEYRREVLRLIEENGVKCVTYFSDFYPESLKNTDSPPIVLYCKGDVSLLKSDCFAVVGSRRTLPKALAECKKISGELSEKFTVVSGIAEGADSAALEGALGCGGKVISVLANGLGKVYPAINYNLQQRIAEKGLLISEYPYGYPPKPYYFPERNRIIAGLSRGVLVVSAGIKSGALITAEYAFEYDREVFAFPYSSGVTSGAGCNKLIKTNAHLTENILDIFSAFGLDLKRRGNCTELSALEKAVLGEISKTDGALLSAVADSLGKQTYEIIPVLTALEIKGLAVRLGGNRYGAV